MAEAHVAGVIHRDLKPANLFVSRRADGRSLIKVLDFGIAKLVSETASLSLTNGVLGSPLYMSPEQLGAAKDIDHRTDIWSLGAILYELVTGSPAFGAGDLPQVCARIAIGTPDPIRAAEVPPELESVILTCLNKRPSERYPSVADLAFSLMPFAHRSSRDTAEAAIRIVQRSTLPHGPLPQAFDSLKPPAFDTTQSSPDLDAEGPRTVIDAGQGITADSAHDRTVNISAKPPSATQGELKPLVFPATLHALAPQEAPRKRPLLWAGLAVAAVALLVTGTRLVQQADPTSTALSAEPVASSIPAAPSVPPNHAPKTRASAQGPIEPLVTPAAETPAPAAARASAPPPIKRPRTPARKSQPAPKSAAEPSAEDLLNHR